MKSQDHNQLLQTLKTRFEMHMHRHKNLTWPEVQNKLASNAKALQSLTAMENTGGEPDVIGVDESTGQLIFCDCAIESPAGRRSMCYDRDALEARKDQKPQHSAVESATEMGIELLTEAQYRALQMLDAFDIKTSSWIHTPAEIRKLGGALFCDRRYDTVFVYHNGAQSYYAARGFRGLIYV